MEDKTGEYNSGLNGPSWFDAMAAWAACEKRFKVKLILGADLTSSVSGMRGLRCSLGVLNAPFPLATAGFGRAYANSTKTLPALVELLVLYAYDELERREGLGLPAEQPELPF